MIDSAQYRLNATKIKPWWAFLQSNRFWVMSLGILSIYLEQKGLIGEPEMTAIASFSALFLAVRTIDRSVDRL